MFGADHVVAYGNERRDRTRVVTYVDNNCPQRTEGGQIVKFLHTRATERLIQLSGGEAAVTVDVWENGATLFVRGDGNAKKREQFTEVGTLKLNK